ncbi:hypothetical protein [Nocardiopsis synnemataformans]|uniref:hypothetical protein n=1 Tax=Nocardiopsis synnemataformans TaxID=61305 RepID=UPI003EBE1FC0
MNPDDSSLLFDGPVDDNEPLDFFAEDEPGFAQIGYWVLFNYHISPTARLLYGVLVGFVNRNRRRAAGDTRVWPTLALLAVSIGVGSGDLVTPYLDELVQVGAIVRRGTYDARGRKTRNRYGVRFNPPRGHTNNLGVIMAHLKAIADTPKQIPATAKNTKAIIKARREQAKNERAAGIDGPLAPAMPPYSLSVPVGNGKSAGQQVPRNSGARTPENRGAHPEIPGSNNMQTPTRGSTYKQEEEGDARPRASETPSSDGWGVQAGTGPAPAAPEPSGTAKAMVAAVAARLGEGLSEREHRALAARYDAAVEVVTALAAEGADVHASHLPEYIDAGYLRPDGTRTYNSFYAVLSFRLSEAEVRGKLPGFVARAVASEASGPLGASGTRGAWGVQGPAASPAPGASPDRCRTHGTRYIPDPSGFGLSCPACAADEPPARPAPPEPALASGPSKVLDALPDPAPADPYGPHCGNERCNRVTRVISRRDGDRVWVEPCPMCRPHDHQQAS